MLPVLAIALLTAAPVQDGYTDTPFIVPGGKWRVHDKFRPRPAVVDPGPYNPVLIPPPADAVVLFDGTNTDAWTKPWKVADGAMVAGGGDNETKQKFDDFQLHIEFATPAEVKGNGQGRGNSGVWLQGQYELQVLDSYQNETYADGQCGALYAQQPPLVNACRKPGQWQTYDIYYSAPRFEGEKVVKPAVVTVIQNGIVVQNNYQLLGITFHKTTPTYKAHGAGPIRLQDHGNPTRFRNIWIRPLKPVE